MAETKISATSLTDMSNLSDFNYAVNPIATEGVSGHNEVYWDSPNFTTYHGYYKTIPELKKAIDALAIWTLGKGFEADAHTRIILENIYGWGEDTFQSILWNLLVIKKINGDAFAEIIRDDESGEIINLKILDPSSIRIVVDEKGLIDRYEQRSKNKEKTDVKEFNSRQILHLSNDRVADEIHGTSVIQACQWVIDARNEAMADKRRILHRSSIRVIEVDTDDTTQHQTLATQYANAIKNGEVMLVPKGNIAFPDIPPLVHESETWIKYLENFFYQAVGIPKIILGGSEEFTEASSKIAYLTFEQVYNREQMELEKDLWNQLGIRIVFNKPASLRSEMLSSEDKNTGQVGFQANDTTANSGADGEGI